MMAALQLLDQLNFDVLHFRGALVGNEDEIDALVSRRVGNAMRSATPVETERRRVRKLKPGPFKVRSD